MSAAVQTQDEFTEAVSDMPTGTWQIDPAHSVVGFAVRHLREAREAWVLDGELTLHGTTRTVSIDLDFLGYDPTGMQGEPRIGFEGRTSINRSDYGVSFGLVDSGKIVVADKVDIRLEIEAVYAAAA